MILIQNHQKSAKNAKISDFWGKFTSKSGNTLKSVNFGPKNAKFPPNWKWLTDFHSVARFGPEYPQKSPIWHFWPIFGKKKSETSGDAVKTEHQIPGRPVICAWDLFKKSQNVLFYDFGWFWQANWFKKHKIFDIWKNWCIEMHKNDWGLKIVGYFF